MSENQWDAVIDNLYAALQRTQETGEVPTRMRSVMDPVIPFRSREGGPRKAAKRLMKRIQKASRTRNR